ncbi:MAG TPA: hypothetical protein VGV09_01840 [Steroidobacteraceae bacterium]|nr:hypothetical protein [Steroidobacteraceae bacterium]
MMDFVGDTDVIHPEVIDSEIRAFFSASVARLLEAVWLRVEARWTADNTPLAVKVFREEGASRREVVKSFDGKLAGGVWEQQWKIELPKGQLDDLHGPINLRFEVQADKHPTPAFSQSMLVHRTRFSS